MRSIPSLLRARRTFLALAFLPPLLLGWWTWQAIAQKPGGGPYFLTLALLWGMAYILLLALGHRWGQDEVPWGPVAALFLTGWGMLGMAQVAPWAAWRQGLWLLLSALALYGWAVLLKVRPSLWRGRTIEVVFWGTLGLLALTLAVGRYPGGAQGARLWLGCCGVYLQPAAWHKTTTVLFLAWGLMQGIPSWLWWLGLALTGLFLGWQGDLGNLALFFLVTLSMLAVHPRWRWRALAGAMLLGLGGVWRFHDLPRVQARLLAWWSPQQDPWGAGYQVLQTLQAVARGGWWGVGPGSLQVAHRVPLVYTDAYYALVAEAWGWWGGGLLLAALGGVALWALRVARRMGFTTAGLAAWGLAGWWMMQTFWVVAGNLRVLPLTGMPIPFTAYGGSELTAAYAGLGVLMWMRGRRSNASPTFWTKTLRWTAWLWGVGMGVLLLAHAWWVLHGA